MNAQKESVTGVLSEIRNYMGMTRVVANGVRFNGLPFGGEVTSEDGVFLGIFNDEHELLIPKIEIAELSFLTSGQLNGHPV